MPTILRVDSYRFFFFSNEGYEAAHVHVEAGEAYAKFWLSPVRLAFSTHFSVKRLTEVRKLIEENENRFLEKWNEYFSKT